MVTVAMKVASLARKRGMFLVVLSAVSALLAAKGTPIGLGFWDGPS